MKKVSNSNLRKFFGAMVLCLATSSLSGQANFSGTWAFNESYSVAGERPLRFDDDRRVRAARRARRRGFGLALRPPLPRPREVRRIGRRAKACFDPIVTLAALARARSPRAARHARAARGAAPGGGARQGAGDARLRERRSARRRAGRGLVRTRVRGDRHEDAAAGRAARPARRRARGREGSARRRTVHLRRRAPPRVRRARNRPARGAAAAAARVRRRQGRPAAAARGARTPTAGTRAGCGRPTRTANGCDVLDDACASVGRDPATMWRTLGLYALCGEDERDLERRFERLREHVAAGCARRRRPRDVPRRPARRHRRRGARAGARSGRRSASTRSSSVSARCRSRSSTPDDVELLLHACTRRLTASPAGPISVGATR